MLKAFTEVWKSVNTACAVSLDSTSRFRVTSEVDKLLNHWHGKLSASARIIITAAITNIASRAVHDLYDSKCALFKFHWQRVPDAGPSGPPGSLAKTGVCSSRLQ